MKGQKIGGGGGGVVVRRSRVNRFSFEEGDFKFAQAIKKNITD